MQMKSFSYKSSDGTELWCNRWFPDEDQQIKGIVVLQHGLKEHSLRYDRIGTILAENGYVVHGFDLRGHGRTAEINVMNNKSIWGKIADSNGDIVLINDLYDMIQELKKDFPDKKIYLLSHSFGSFITQRYLELYGDNINGAILLGTTGPNKPLVVSGKIFANIIKLFNGKNNTSKILDKVIFGSYNKRISNPKTEYDWLTNDDLIIQMYISDNWCGNLLTTSFFIDLLNLLLVTHKSKNISKIPNDIPLFIGYGSEDPVGGYGKLVTKLVNKYRQNGMKKVTSKCYENSRHELLNESIKETVEKDIIEWLNSN